jgi:hypothetical protein
MGFTGCLSPHRLRLCENPRFSLGEPQAHGDTTEAVPFIQSFSAASEAHTLTKPNFHHLGTAADPSPFRDGA